MREAEENAQGGDAMNHDDVRKSTHESHCPRPRKALYCNRLMAAPLKRTSSHATLRTCGPHQRAGILGPMPNTHSGDSAVQANTSYGGKARSLHRAFPLNAPVVQYTRGFGVSRTEPPQPGRADEVRCRSLGHPQEAEAPWPKRAPRQGASARSGPEKPSSAEGIVKARVESIHRQRRLSATCPSVPAHRAVGYPGEAGSRPRKPDRPKLNPSLCKQGGVQRVRPRSPAHRSAGYPPDITA